MAVRKLNEVRLLGRQMARDGWLDMHWPGSGAEFGFEGELVYAQIEASYQSQPPYVVVTADGEPFARFPLERGAKRYLLFATTGEKVKRDIAILRDTQPIPGEPSLVRLGQLSFEGEITAPSPRKYKIEFIGDSLTSGEGLLGNQGEMEWLTAWMSYCQSYAYFVGRQLNAQCRVLSQGGWGVYCDYRCNRENNLPALFPYVCAANGDMRPVDFDAWQPDAVVISLLSNDANLVRAARERGGDVGAAREALVRAALGFVTEVRRAYPRAHILWTYGMCDHQIADVFKRVGWECQDPNFSTLLLPSAGPQDMGARAHPGRAFQQRCGTLLAQALKARL